MTGKEQSGRREFYHGVQGQTPVKVLGFGVTCWNQHVRRMLTVISCKRVDQNMDYF